MRDGLYRVHFQTPIGQGAGVVVLQGGQLRGGDSAMYYTGTYSETGGQFTSQVLAKRHSQGLQSVFPIDTVNIQLTGRTSGDSAQMTGSAKEAPGVNFQAALARIAD